jgi:hypothetical protein
MKYFTNIFTRSRGFYERRYEPEGVRSLAESYWRILLSFSFISIVLILFFGVWEFIGVVENLSSAQTGGFTAHPVSLNRSQLEATLNAYQMRQFQYKDTQTNPRTFADPSR